MTRVTASVAASPEASSEPPQRAPRAVTTWPVTSSFTIFHPLHCQLRTHQKETDMLPKLSQKAPHFQLAHLGLPHAKSAPRWGHLQPSPHPAGLCVCARVSAMPSPERALSKHPPLRPRGSPSTQQDSDLAPSAWWLRWRSRVGEGACVEGRVGRSETETCPRGRSKSPCPQLEESQRTSISVLCRQLPGNPGISCTRQTLVREGAGCCRDELSE